MWRFVLVSLVVMGWSFYELSGGSDYAPVENSIQVQGLPDRTPPRPAAQEPAARNRTLAQVEAMMDELGRAQTEAEDRIRTEAEELSLTLAAVNTDGPSIIEAEASRPKAELLELQIEERRGESTADIEAAVAAAIGDVTADPSRLRWVKETVVDLRTGPGLTFDKVARITKGTEVAVLEDPGHGWLNVRVMDTYQTGWLAEWLVTLPE